jgi:hypothetical protein
MSLGTAVLLGFALSTPSAPPAPAATGAQGPRAPAAAVACTKYRAQVEKNALASEHDLASWANLALDRAALLDARSPCFVHVRITAGPIHTGGREDGWMAHVGVSTRRYLKDGKHVTHEKGMLLVEPTREGLVPRVRSFVEEFVSALRSAPASFGDSG